MKILSLKIHNVGILEDVDLTFDLPLLLFYGGVREGKSTILNALRWAFGGAFPSDIVRHGQDEAFVEIVLDDGIIRREWYRARNGETKARDISFVRNGRPVPSPVNEIKRMINPFLSDQDFLRKMGETERKQYFAQMLAVDTKALDTELFEKDREATRLRTVLSTYGKIDLTPVPPSDAAEIRNRIKAVKDEHARMVVEWTGQLREIRNNHSAAVQKIGQENVDANGRQSQRQSWTDELVDLDIEIKDLTEQLARKNNRKAQVGNFLVEFPPLEIKPTPPAPDTAELEAHLLSVPATRQLETQLEDATRNEERARQLEDNKKRADKRDQEEKELKAAELRIKTIKAEKIAKLKEVGEKCGIAELEFDEHGNFTYQGCQAGMLSTSQLMKLSSQLSALYPEGLGIELIDRAESLGKSIFGFIDEAKEKKRTILATIVGDAPAKVPEQVGVFVVEKGKVTKKKSEYQPDFNDVPTP